MPYACVILSQYDKKFHLVCSNFQQDMIRNPNRTNTLICSYGCNHSKPFCNVSDLQSIIDRDFRAGYDRSQMINDISNQLQV